MNGRIEDSLAGVCASLRATSVASGTHLSDAAVRCASLSETAPRDRSQIRDVLVVAGGRVESCSSCVRTRARNRRRTAGDYMQHGLRVRPPSRRAASAHFFTMTGIGLAMTSCSRLAETARTAFPVLQRSYDRQLAARDVRRSFGSGARLRRQANQTTAPGREPGCRNLR